MAKHDSYYASKVNYVSVIQLLVDTVTYIVLILHRGSGHNDSARISRVYSAP